MNKLKNTKKIYDNIEIPKELRTHVAESINSVPKKTQFRFSFKLLTYATVGMCIAFIISINTSDVLAQTLNEIPIINVITKVLTIKSYQAANEFNHVDVQVPALYGVEDTKVQDRINTVIEDKINETVGEAKIRSQQYYKEFIAAGNKKSDFLPMDIKVDYAVKFSNYHYVSFIVTSLENHISAITTKDFYNINLKTGDALTLKSIVGENYLSIINEQVKAEIEKRLTEEELFFVGEGAFTTITSDQPFYINQDKQLVIVFEKYSIAPGFMGFPEFIIETPLNLH